jgi:hypothetical protein
VLRGYVDPDTVRAPTDSAAVSVFIYVSLRWTGVEEDEDDEPRQIVYLRRGMCIDGTRSGLVLHERGLNEASYASDMAEYDGDLRDVSRSPRWPATRPAPDNIACRFSNFANFVHDHGYAVGLWPGCFSVPVVGTQHEVVQTIVSAISAALTDGFAAD